MRKINISGQALKGFIQLVLIIVFIVTSVGISRSLQSKRPEPSGDLDQDRALSVHSEVFKKENHRVGFTTTGTINALAQIDIVPQVSGQIIFINSELYEGGEFDADELLFKVDPRDFEVEVARLSAEVARAQTSLDIEKAEADAAVKEWTMVNPDLPIPELVAREPQLAQAEAQLKSAQALLAKAELDLSRTEFTLPFSGRVVSSNLGIGRYVIAGQAYGQVFDIAGLEVRASLENQQLEWLLEAEKPIIRINVDYLGQSSEFEGLLKRSASVLDERTRFGRVSFGFQSKDLEARSRLLPGVFVNIEIQGKMMDDIMRIPNTAIQNGGSVWTIDKQERLRQKMPSVVYINDSYIAVRGITDGARLVTQRLTEATEGMRVNLVKQ